MAELIVALDYPASGPAVEMATRLLPARPWVKVGLELLMSAGPQVVREISMLGLPVFLDGKFHDIPNTVAGAVRAATRTGASIINVHAAGGLRMMQAAREAAAETAAAMDIPCPLVIAVTVLTSIAPEELRDEVGVPRTPQEQVVALAQLAQRAGLDGVVASAQEVRLIKEACGPAFRVITPGIRPTAGAADDQRRIATPAQAVRDGADFLVVGRPITAAADPVAACAAVLAEMAH